MAKRILPLAFILLSACGLSIQPVCTKDYCPSGKTRAGEELPVIQAFTAAKHHYEAGGVNLSREFKRLVPGDNAVHIEPRLAFKILIETSEPLDPASINAIRILSEPAPPAGSPGIIASLDTTGTQLSFEIPGLMVSNDPALAKFCVLAEGMKTRSGKGVPSLKRRIFRIIGDATGDGLVNDEDQERVSYAWENTSGQIIQGQTNAHLAAPSSPGSLEPWQLNLFSTSDFNLDGLINASDMAIALSEYGKTLDKSNTPAWPAACQD